MVAIQGPKALMIMNRLAGVELGGMKYYSARIATVANTSCLVSRTGYTGEDGFELTVPSETATSLWESILECGHDQGAVPAGLGCRDTLRLEAAMPLYGHELSEAINPVQTGLARAYDLDGRDFVGRRAILEALRDGPKLVRVGMRLGGRRVPRQGYAVLKGGQAVGEVTSGTFSPTLQCPIAMGYVGAGVPTIENDLTIDIRGRQEPVQIASLPFYQRPA